MSSIASRLNCLLLAGLSAMAGLAAAPFAGAQNFPTQPLRFVLPVAPGNVTDILGRLYATRLAERRGWTVVPENRPGGDFVIAAQNVVQSPPDGHTVLLAIMSMTILPSAKKNLPLDFARDLLALVRVANIQAIIVAHPSVPVSGFKELVAYSKVNPGKLSWAGVGSGTTAHLTYEWLRQSLGLDATYVPYKAGGTAAMTADVLNGRTHINYGTLGDYAEHVRAGKLRGIFVSGNERNPLVPDVPTLIEIMGDPNMDTASWYGFMASAPTPRPVAAILERELLAISQLADVQAQSRKIGLIPISEGAAVFAKRYDADIQRWARVIREGNISFD